MSWMQINNGIVIKIGVSGDYLQIDSGYGTMLASFGPSGLSIYDYTAANQIAASVVRMLEQYAPTELRNAVMGMSGEYVPSVASAELVIEPDPEPEPEPEDEEDTTPAGITAALLALRDELRTEVQKMRNELAADSEDLARRLREVLKSRFSREEVRMLLEEIASD